MVNQSAKSQRKVYSNRQDKGLIGVVLADLCRNAGLEVAVCEDKSDRVCSICTRKVRNVHQLYSFVVSSLMKDALVNKSEKRFKRCLSTLFPLPERSPAMKKMQKNTELSPHSIAQKISPAFSHFLALLPSLSLSQLLPLAR